MTPFNDTIMRQADSFSKLMSSIMMIKTHWCPSAHNAILFGNTLQVFVTFPLISLGYGEDLGPRQLSRYSDSLWVGRSRDRIPEETRFSAPVQTGPVTHPASYTLGTGSLPGVKRPGRGVDYPFSAEVKERVELHLHSLCGPSWSVLGWTLIARIAELSVAPSFYRLVKSLDTYVGLSSMRICTTKVLRTVISF